ncbi:Alpha/Beta hydrolase protein [Naematelia encephala]|uniref:Alpha/Beta hydrolase protein n=1 Tax=Naematelia encephala TaxID=71784 RepID=A0A1Y2BEX4_9TREE|nr:Alpha/Beta hydrolase protein [Naematelia encephala]
MTSPQSSPVWGEMTSEAIQVFCLASAPRCHLLRHSLLRRVYLVSFVFVTLFLLLPAWTLLYLPRSNRPRPSWTLKRCLRVRWSRRLCGVVARCEIDYLGRDLSRPIDPQTLSYSHPVTIPPAPMSALRGHPAQTLAQLHESRGHWNPHFIHRRERSPTAWGEWNGESSQVYGLSAIPGFWYTGLKRRPDDGPPPLSGEPVMLHFHGGGYLCGTAAETDLTSSIAKSLVIHSPIHHVLSVDYRLAPKAPWPLPLLDAISAYWYLVKHENIPEKDIVIAGDSAGGHLALALVRYLRDERILGMPRGLVCLSPWVDVGFTNAWGEDGYTFNAASDTIDSTFGPFATSLLLRALPASTMHTSPYLSPASLLIEASATGPLSFEDFPPIFIVYGGAERLGRSIEGLWSRFQLARKVNASPLPDKIVVGEDCVHDFMIFPWQAEEAAKVYAELDAWLRDLLALEDDKPTSPGLVASPTILNSHRSSRADYRASRSPIMGPMRDKSVMMMVEDMRDEGLSMIDLPPLDLDAGEWLSPFTSQFEKGHWDWEDESWFDPDD